ncbi:MAG: biliverdin-producing heme oxygenase [Rhodoferax sp.]|nr:biliverdin-producing heme oxygenase [Rhodoferax sp.]
MASLADTLKESTKEAHARAERHEVQAKMVKGEITRQEYGAWLGQMLPLWSAVDAQLSALAVRDARVCAMVKPPRAWRHNAICEVHQQRRGKRSAWHSWCLVCA